MQNLHGKKILIAPLILALFCLGCARTTPPDPSIEAARSAIGEATRNEAAQYAPSELSKAQQKLSLAEQATRDDHTTIARRLGEQATVDARYAQVRAQAEKAQSAAIETRDTTETIQGIR